MTLLCVCHADLDARNVRNLPGVQIVFLRLGYCKNPYAGLSVSGDESFDSRLASSYSADESSAFGGEVGSEREERLKEEFSEEVR